MALNKAAKELGVAFCDEVISKFPVNFELNPVEVLKCRYYSQSEFVDPVHGEEYKKIYSEIDDINERLSSRLQPEDMDLLIEIEDLYTSLGAIMHNIAFRNGLRDGFILARTLFK